MSRQLKYFVKKTTRTLRALAINDSWRKKVFYLKQDYPGELVEDSTGVLLKPVNLHLRRNEFSFVLDQFQIIRTIHQHLNAQFYIDNNKFFVRFGDITLNPTTAEEIFIIEEVFVQGSYNFSTDKSLVIFDVGMNVGTASLFFASHNNVTKVYSYEPFAPTFKQAINNIDNNDKLKQKIITHSFGLSDKDESLEVAYSYENKGQVGIYGTDLIRSEVDKKDFVSIQLKKASNQIRRVIEENKNKFFGLKLDCEGAEYAIFNDLAQQNMLSHFKIIFIEWHEKGPEELLALLTSNGFTSFYQQASGKKVGMIYASR